MLGNLQTHPRTLELELARLFSHVWKVDQTDTVPLNVSLAKPVQLDKLCNNTSKRPSVQCVCAVQKQINNISLLFFLCNKKHFPEI